MVVFEPLEKAIAALIARTLKEQTGKGPRKVQVYIKKDVILVRVIEYLSTVETHLAESEEGAELVKLFRAKIQKQFTIPQYIHEIQELLGIQVMDCFLDLHPDKNEAIVVFILAQELEIPT